MMDFLGNRYLNLIYVIFLSVIPSYYSGQALSETKDPEYWEPRFSPTRGVLTITSFRMTEHGSESKKYTLNELLLDETLIPVSITEDRSSV